MQLTGQQRTFNIDAAEIDEQNYILGKHLSLLV